VIHFGGAEINHYNSRGDNVSIEEYVAIEYLGRGEDK
jgi:hypothetical protein